MDKSVDEILKTCQQLEEANSVKIQFTEQDPVEESLIAEIEANRAVEREFEESLSQEQLREKYLHENAEANQFASAMGMKIVKIKKRENNNGKK